MKPLNLLARTFLILALLGVLVSALPYDPDQTSWNLNQNAAATNPLEYWGEWPDHTYQPSPENWRFPFYTIFLDRFVNGDPTNDDANGTQWEHDLTSNQFRHGGDVLGLMDTFDYLQGMGIKGIYLAGTPFINEPWGADGYSPLDLTLLDHHYGTINDWRTMISEAHQRGMYILMDNTFGTLGDLVGFQGYLNTSAPINPYEYNYVWKYDRRYFDFQPGNDWMDVCEWEYPRFWKDDGSGLTNTTLVAGCRNSEFDQYGEIPSFGNYTEWQAQIAKFAFVQDRLREWRPDVLQKIKHFSCLTIAMLDIDGYRIDKGIQVTLDALGEWSEYIRQCARQYGKENFYIPGEIVSGNSFGALYIGRGHQTNQTVPNMTEAVTMTNKSIPDLFLRPAEQSALDGAAFHYTFYRALCRFLGLDGQYAAQGDPPANFIATWNGLLETNDMVNANTGKFDPRHLYGTSNQDVFRWPAIKNGTEKQVLGLYIVTLLMPGVPLLNWGEEQNFYVLDNTDDNYLFGRSPMSSAQAWQLHGCYRVGASKYYDFPLDNALNGCSDDSVSLDHRDPSHPIRGLLKTMFEIRQNYPVLNDGYYLQQLSNKTYDIYLPGSGGTPTETGMWSVMRSRFVGVQDFTGIGQGNQTVWLVYQNDNRTIDYQFNCTGEDPLVSPFDAGTTVKNLLPPFDEYTLVNSSTRLGLEGSEKFNGCLPQITLPAWGFKAFVPKDKWIRPTPYITKFTPGHDARLVSKVSTGETVKIGFQFSQEMDCDNITKSLSVKSTALDNQIARFNTSSVSCGLIEETEVASWSGALTSVFNYEIELVNVFHGVHEITVNNVTNKYGNSSTNSVDHFIFRIGDTDNPMVWPQLANYSRTLLYQDSSGDGTLWVAHKAPGADLWRYTLDFGSSYSDWMPYGGGNVSIPPKNWTGTPAQAWSGEHIMVQYWSKITASSDHYQHGDADWTYNPPRRFPHFWIEGKFNQFGYDAGYENQMSLSNITGRWEIHFMSEWPAQVSFNAWGMDPDGVPDQTQTFGDIDGDHVLDRIAPITLLSNFFNVTNPPPWPKLAYMLSIDDGNLRVYATPVGSQVVQMMLFILLAVIPLGTAATAVWIYLKAFYQVKFNEVGVSEKRSIFRRPGNSAANRHPESMSLHSLKPALASVTKVLNPQKQAEPTQATPVANTDNRRTVLVATMEYDIEDWGIKIKIGGLGVMAQLMAKNLGHQNLIWVVPCVGDIDYPVDQKADPMIITILGNSYQVDVQYHVLRNITYVLLDAPVFRKQSKSDPYPPRMDDLDSAIYYSAWNSCIAEALKRFPVDLYHINDYHGAAAPLHLLPSTIPCCLSLHNAEFQGLWPMRTARECDEVCQVFNLDPAIVKKYIQFGDVFNLLHAAVSYLQIHQNGFGAVGVSKKYGKRSYARYPIFWGLKEIGSLPNPDPSDTADWKRGEQVTQKDVHVDPEFEAKRQIYKQQAQEWAGLKVNPDAELFVFVGRWSMQKGIDLIADIFPSILESHPGVQLICVGPVIDLYGRFAAIKLEKMMELYPGRVYSKPEFTSLPPFIFSGAEFALIPSRDEPFGLVAVEFGRKGALGVGSRVGGLGQMPGWWYTIESMTTKHLIHQFKLAINEALGSKPETRAIMRARSGKQRFPVAQWVQDLETLQSTAIEKHKKYSKQADNQFWRYSATTLVPSPESLSSRPRSSGTQTPPADSMSPDMSRFGYRRGPGHTRNRLSRRMNSQVTAGASSTAEEESVDEDSSTVYYADHEVGAPRPARMRHAQSRIAFTLGDPSDDRDLPSNIGDSVVYSRPDSPVAFPGMNTSSGLLTPPGINTPSRLSTDDSLLNPPLSARNRHSSSMSLVSVEGIVKEKQDYNLQKVSPFFTDANNEYARSFQRKLERLNGKNSEDQLCIETYLEKSEKDWFNRYRDVKLGKSPVSTPASSVFRLKINGASQPPTPTRDSFQEERVADEFLLPKDYVPPSGLRRFLLRRIGDWPFYSILLAFGQIIAANSYQITLLNGEIGQTAEKLYIVATIYLISSVVWWTAFRMLKSVYVLCIPFLLYGLAFFFVGLAPAATNSTSRFWIQNMGTGFYAFASSSGSIFFSLNFGDEGGASTTSWVYRACVVQGTQQIFVSFLWYWGSWMASVNQNGSTQYSLVNSSPHVLTGVGISVACFLWTIGAMLFFGLPEYYRQVPGEVPAFYRSVFRRKIVLWFFYAVLVQNYWLSPPYGRNWLYLWTSQHAKPWEIVLLVLFFFIFVWALVLWMFGTLSKRHAWFIPIFSIGLGAPRWAQILWSTSNIGTYVPWAGGPIASALVGRGLWLWLGVLDSLQGVGFGMILLNTLTRFHITFTLLAAQVVGSIATILGRATAPDKLGPGDVFPDFSAGVGEGLAKADFWVCLLFMLSINVLCFMFFRKEQLQKP